MFLSILLFGISGSFYWYNGWILIVTFTSAFVVNFTVLILLNPEVIEERMRFQKGSKKWDVVLMSIATVVIIGALVTAAVDKRYELSTIDDSLIPAGIFLFAAGDSIMVWCMVVNKWFSKLVRIQTERGHTVVDTGPYAFVRHPGYLGWIIMSSGITLILGSLWTIIPTVLLSILIIIRTYLEDITLKNELNGYLEYSFRIKYRLIPGIW